MTVVERVRELVEPLLSARDLDLYDVELAGPVLRVVVDRPGPLDLDALGEATRAVSRALDEADPIAGAYTLEVTSPGLERTLRTPAHFERAVGEQVKIKLRAGAAEGDERRLAGVVAAADAEAVTVRTGDAGDTGDTGAGERRLAYDDIERARTVFAWGPSERPGGRRSREKRDHRS
ncbi:MAG TPA: ribosome maturation factor RimP [Acidimicrobiales bacterium]|nr:ribosome maturation factor RimP [Acidimicrobiales bacterium]